MQYHNGIEIVYICFNIEFAHFVKLEHVNKIKFTYEFNIQSLQAVRTTFPSQSDSSCLSTVLSRPSRTIRNSLWRKSISRDINKTDF